jgi:hypothetical protein
MSTVRKFIWRFFLTVLLLCVATVAFLYFANFSSGFRTGVPIKMSNKGVLFKTWEGELNVGGLANTAEGAIPATWAFSVKKSDKDVIEKIDQAIVHGNRVKLLYHEKYVKFFWLGDTKHFVHDVEILPLN